MNQQTTGILLSSSLVYFYITQFVVMHNYNAYNFFIWSFIAAHPQQKEKRRRKLICEPIPAAKSDTATHSSLNTQSSLTVLENSTSFQSQSDTLSVTQSSAATHSGSNKNSPLTLDQSNICESRCFQSPSHSQDVQETPFQDQGYQDSPLQSDDRFQERSQNSPLSVTAKSQLLADDEDELGPSCSSNGIEEKTEMLLSMFPNMSLIQIKFLLDVSKGDCNAVCNILLEGLTAASIINFWKQSSGEVRRICLETYKAEHALEELLAFYKSNRFTPNAIVRVSIADQPAIDTGGVRRQFYNDALIQISNNEHLFEHTESGILPVFRQSTLSSGLFTTIGKLIGHSIIMDSQGFPYLSTSIYYYMAGLIDAAVSAVSMEDLGGYTKHIVSKVQDFVLHLCD